MHSGKKISGYKEILSRRLAGFRSVGLAFTIFSLVNIAIYLLIFLHPPLLKGLWLSADRPWGIVTSAFVHRDLGHLVSNLREFVFAAGFFVVVNLHNRVRARRYSSRIFLWLIFLSGFAANGIEFLAWHWGGVSGVHSWGASGVVYAGIGVLLASTLCNFPAHMRNFDKARRRRPRRGKRKLRRKFDWSLVRSTAGLLSMTLALTLLVLLFWNPGAFLSVGPGVNVLAHGLGFLLGFAPSMLLFHLRASRGEIVQKLVAVF